MTVYVLLHYPNPDEARLLAAFADRAEAEAVRGRIGTDAEVRELVLDEFVGATWEEGWEVLVDSSPHGPWGGHFDHRLRKPGEAGRFEPHDALDGVAVVTSFVSPEHAREVAEGLRRSDWFPGAKDRGSELAPTPPEG